MTDKHPVFLCTVTFNPSENSVLPYETAVQAAAWYRAGQIGRARMQRSGRRPLLLTRAAMAACTAQLHSKPACESTPQHKST